MAELRQAGAGDKADITSADHRYFHLLPCFVEVIVFFKLARAAPGSFQSPSRC
jgi:hypothetical protein